MPDLESLETLPEQVNEAYGYPAVAAAVACRGRILGAGAIGVRKVGRRERLTLEDRFHIGSTAKPMTATALATIVEERRLRWDSTPMGLFPEPASARVQ